MKNIMFSFNVTPDEIMNFVGHLPNGISTVEQLWDNIVSESDIDNSELTHLFFVVTGYHDGSVSIRETYEPFSQNLEIPWVVNYG
jgi:hypothetical protein